MVAGGGGDTAAKVGGWDDGCLLRRKVLIMCLLIICLFVECLFVDDMFVLNVLERLVITSHCLVLQTLRSQLTKDRTVVMVSSG